ncbi:hypothetical protein ACQ4LE_000359 [Meloidogyne hapla]
MSNSFYVCLLSNVPDYPDNQPNKFRVHLPRPLYFSGDWVCGVHSISYPYSWSSTIGTLDEQWIKIHFIDENLKKNVIRIPVPAASHINVEALKNYLATTLKHQSDSIGSLDKSGTFIRPPSVLSSPPRAEKRKRSAEEPVQSPPPYIEEENDTPQEEPRSPPPYIEEEIKDKPSSPPPQQEPRSPSPYLEPKSPPLSSTPPKDKKEETQIIPPLQQPSPEPPKDKKEETHKSSPPPANVEPPKDNQTQITPQQEPRKPSPNVEPPKDKKENQTQIAPPHQQEPRSPSPHVEPSKDKKEHTQITSVKLNKEEKKSSVYWKKSTGQKRREKY